MMRDHLDIDALANRFLYQCELLGKIKVAVVYPLGDDALAGALEAAEMGLIDPILIGPHQKIEKLAKQDKLDISHYEIIDASTTTLATQKAITLVHEKKVVAIMKGNLHTDELMKEVVKSDTGLRTHRRISHVFIMAMEHYHKPFIITDAAININPDLLTKKDIIQNAVDFFHALHSDDIIPKVAILSAVETVNPLIPSTIDAACLCKMSERGQITGAIVDGPFAYDNVLSIEAAKTKHIESSVVGDADIFVVPNLEAGNMLAKQLVLITKAISAGIILGAKVPIILTSRSDGVQSRISSCAVANLLVHKTKPFWSVEDDY